jgi:uncharacterized protein (TIGR03067 family)
MFRWMTVALLAVPFLVAPGQAAPETKLDPAKLVGDWDTVSGKSAGQPIPPDRLPKKVTITKDTITLPSPEGKFVFGYKVDPSTSPAKLEMTIKESPFGEDNTITRGLIQLDGEELKLGYVVGAETFPPKLDSTVANGMRLFVFKKAK